MSETLSTPEKILKAARKLFVKNGYAGTSIAKIAKEADVTHSLIFHHYGNKEKLWVAVKQDIVDEANHQQSTIPSLKLDLKEFVQQAMDNMLRFYRNNPDIVQMITWQRIEYDNWQKAGIGASTSFEEWRKAFSHYQSLGAIKSSIKLEYVVIFMISLANTIALDPITYLQNEKEEKAYKDFCVKSLCEILEV